MTPVDASLLDIAVQLGVTITYTDDLPDDRDGDYDKEGEVIRLRPGMHARHHRTVLAHELGHAVFQDVPSKFGPVNAKQEARAEAWASLRLISLDDYRIAEQVCQGHAGAMAVELGVMRSTVLAFRSLLARVGDTTYFRSGMGAGQWAHKEDAAGVRGRDA